MEMESDIISNSDKKNWATFEVLWKNYETMITKLP